MFLYKHKSGAQKRQERQQRVNEEKKRSRTLFDVGVIEHSAEPTSEVALKQVSQANIVQTEVIEPEQEEEACEVKITDYGNNVPTKELDDQSSSHIASCEELGTKSTFMARFSFDIGTLTGSPALNELEDIVRAGHLPHPKQFPCDVAGNKFPTSVLTSKKQNGETSSRGWIVFSPIRKAIYCFPCRLFCHAIDHPTQSSLASPGGWNAEKKWRKLWERIPEHEKSTSHRKCYLLWRELQRRLENDAGINVIVEENILSEAAKWKKLLTRIVDVVIFLGERGLAFRGSSHRIGDVCNGNFLGLLELLAHYDPLLEEHLTKVKVAQQKGERLQAHYLSPESQNEFISICAADVRRYILKERELTKYYSIMIDATPDSSHIEQTTFILRFLTIYDESYVVQERFLAFADCSRKTGIDIAKLILETLKDYGIPIADCRGQGYDNAANMSGKYNGAQQHITSVNSLCLYSPCGCHSLNLCGVDSAASCTEAVTYFGMVQTIYNLFSSSPQRWQILQRNIACSLHGLSGTRWTDHVF